MVRVDRMLERAVQAARLSTEPRKHGCVVALGSRVLAVGVNTRRNHPEACSYPESEASYHAEVAALRALHTTVDTGRLDVYSARVDKFGTPKLAKPCARCAAVLAFAGFRNIYWTEG